MKVSPVAGDQVPHQISAEGKHVVITGASSGIGKVTALKVAQAGGIPVLVARGKDKLEETRADAKLVQELEEYGVIKGITRSGVKYYDETEREIVRAVAELARYGVGGRNLRVFRSSADREAALLEHGPVTEQRHGVAADDGERLPIVERLYAADQELQGALQHIRHLLLVVSVQRHQRALLQVDLGEHLPLAPHHLA